MEAQTMGGRRVLASDEEGPRLVAAAEDREAHAAELGERMAALNAAAEGQEPPAEPEASVPAGEPEQLRLSFDVGGKRPTSSSLRLVGGAIDGEFGNLRKGEKLILRIEAEVGEVSFKDVVDGKTGQVVGCERRHKARIVAPPVREAA